MLQTIKSIFILPFLLVLISGCLPDVINKELLRQKVYQAYDSAQYNDVIKYADQFLVIDSSDYLIWFYKSRSHSYLIPKDKLYDKESFKESIYAVEKSIKINSDFDRSYFIRSLYFRFTNQLEKSLEDINKAISLAPENMEYFEFRAVSHHLLEMYQKAIDDYTTILNEDQYNYLSYVSRSICYARLNKFQLALNDTENAILLKPKNGIGYEQMGYILLTQEKYKEAINSFNTEISLNEEVGVSDELKSFGFLNRAFCHEKLANHDQADKDISKALLLKSDNPYALKTKAFILINRGDKEQACKLLQESLDIGFHHIHYKRESDKMLKENCM